MKNVTNFSHPTASGFNLIEISEDIWQLQIVDSESFFGTFKEVLIFANLRYSINLKEIDMAVQCMIKEGHNAAHFGMWGTFIFTFKKIFDQERKVS